MNAIRLQYWNQTVVRHKPRGRPVNPDLPNERLQWDWTIKDADLARQHGLTRERVRQIRAKLGVGPTRYKYLHYRAAEVDAERMFRDGIVMDAHEFAAKHKILVGQARIILRRRNCIVRPKTRVHPWHLFNLDLPSKVLAEIWGVPFVTAIPRWRAKYGLPLSPYDGRKLLTVDQISERDRLIEAEKLKAQQYYATRNGTKPAEDSPETSLQEGAD
jgi:hypothetical protein